jgi:hypothetical protein
LRQQSNRNLEQRPPVNSGDFTDIQLAGLRGYGRVYHLVNIARSLIVNITAESHLLHPGYVIRRIYYAHDGFIS